MKPFSTLVFKVLTKNLRVREHSCHLGLTNSCPTNAVLMSYSHMPSRPYEFSSGRTTSASDPNFVHIHRRRVLLCPLRQSETKCSQTFPHVLQPNTSRGLRIPPVTLDLFHCLCHRPQTNQMAQVSMSSHVEHLGSKVSRIVCSKNFAQRQLLALHEIFHEQQSKLNVLHATETHFRMLRDRGSTVRKYDQLQINAQLFRNSSDEESLACPTSEGVPLGFRRRQSRRSLCSTVSEDCAATELCNSS